jgi:hypothetical protein
MTYLCRYCKKEFSRESTLTSHLCEAKRRILDKDQVQNRIAFQSWLLFRKLTMPNAKKEKSYEDFVGNSLYKGFMKLAKYIIDLNLAKGEDFVRFLIMNSVPMRRWTSDAVFDHYVKEQTKKESVERAIERSVLNMKAWAERTKQDWQNYFQSVDTAQAVQDIRMGRISPWCTFATDQGSRLIDRFEPGQIQTLIDYMEPNSWRAKVLRQREDAEWVQTVFNQAEIK